MSATYDFRLADFRILKTRSLGTVEILAKTTKRDLHHIYRKKFNIPLRHFVKYWQVAASARQPEFYAHAR